MFLSSRLVSLSFRASRSAFRSTNVAAFHPIKPIVFHTYATRRGASSRPTKVKEQEEQQQQQYPVAQHYEQQTQTPNQTGQQYAYPQAGQYAYPPGYTAAQVIDSNASLQAFLRRSMVTTAAGIGVSGLAAAAFMQMPIVLAHPYWCLGLGLVGSLAGLFGMGMVQPTYVKEGEVVKAVDSPARQALFGTLLIAEGLSLAPMLKMVSVVTPMAIPIAGVLAVGTMAGMASYALKQPQGSLAKWGPALYVGIFGLIGAGLVNMFVHSSILSMGMSVAGIGIFAAFTAYDTHTAIDDHNNGQPDHLMTAANFYLNFVNLFLYYLRLAQSFLED